ncbi:MAG: hypothetical protein RQ756_01380, partial [Flavobacteriaceae bacterium]|nr:hypothetical protein [Flavobacteriaceae bacterium]
TTKASIYQLLKISCLGALLFFFACSDDDLQAEASVELPDPVQDSIFITSIEIAENSPTNITETYTLEYDALLLTRILNETQNQPDAVFNFTYQNTRWTETEFISGGNLIFKDSLDYSDNNRIELLRSINGQNAQQFFFNIDNFNRVSSINVNLWNGSNFINQENINLNFNERQLMRIDRLNDQNLLQERINFSNDVGNNPFIHHNQLQKIVYFLDFYAMGSNNALQITKQNLSTGVITTIDQNITYNTDNFPIEIEVNEQGSLSYIFYTYL